MFNSPSIPTQTATQLVPGVWVVLLFAFLFRCYVAYVFPYISADELVQLVSAKQVALGHGVSLVQAQPHDLAQFRYEPLDKWPPGFALGVGLFMRQGLPHHVANFLVDVLGLAAFFLGWALLFRRLHGWVSPLSQALFIFFAGVSYMPWQDLGTTDLVSLGFCVLGLALAVELMVTPKGTDNYRLALLLAVSAFCCSFFRFAYYPVTLLLPMLVVVCGWLGQRRLHRTGLFALFFTVTLVAAMQVFIYLQRQDITYLTTHHPVSERLFFPEHLLKVNPFSVNAFFPEFLIQVKVGLGVSRIFNWVVSGVVLLVLFLLMRAWVRGKGGLRKMQGPLTPLRVLLGCMVAISITIFIFLVGLSLMLPSIPARWTSDGLWTYVQEMRYYAPVLLFIGFGVVLAAVEKRMQVRKLGRLVAVGLVGTSLLFSLGMWGYYATRYSFTDGPGNLRQYYGWSHDLPDFLEREQFGQSPVPVVFMAGTTYYWIEMLFTLEGTAPLELDAVQEPRLWTSAPVRVLLPLKKGNADAHSQKMKQLIRTHQATLLGEIQDVELEIWEAHILPE